MSLTLMIGAAALVLLLAALLVMQRRRAAAATGDGRDDAPARAAPTGADTAGLAPDEWREPGFLDRALILLRGRGKGLALLRNGPDGVHIRRDGQAVCVVNDYDSVYGGRPKWDHIAGLTLDMGKAERCFPAADLSGLLRYIDKTVPVEYSPRLLADLEDGSTPDPRKDALAN